MDEPRYAGVSNRTFGDFWHGRVDTNPDAEFLVYGSTTLTFGQLDEAADGHARQPGSRSARLRLSHPPSRRAACHCDITLTAGR